MMIETSIATILAPVFGDEIYPVVHPDPDGKVSSVSTLYAVYTKIGGQDFNTLESDISLSRPRIQISIYSTNYGVLKTKEQAVAAAMLAANNNAALAITNGLDPLEVSGALPNVSVSVPTDGFEYETKRYYVHMEFYCWSNGGV